MMGFEPIVYDLTSQVDALTILATISILINKLSQLPENIPDTSKTKALPEKNVFSVFCVFQVFNF